MGFEGVTDVCDGGEACHGISQPPQICSMEELNKYVDQKRVHWRCEYTALEKVSSILTNELHNITPYHSSNVYWKVKNNFLQVLASYPPSQWAVEVLLGTGLIIPFLRKWSGIATSIFLVLIYPANLNMWINDLSLGDGTDLSPSGHLIRMLVQMTAIAVCLWISRKNKTLENKAS